MKRHRDAIPQNEGEARSREQALAVLALMRRKGLSLRAAAREIGTNSETVLRYVGSELRREGSRGVYRATAHDRISRTLHFITPAGRTEVKVFLRRLRLAHRPRKTNSPIFPATTWRQINSSVRYVAK